MELTDKNYETVIKQNDKPVLIDFYSPECAPCQVLLKLINESLGKYGEEKGIVIATCDISKNSKLSEAFKVRSVPFTIAVMPDGKLKYPEIGLKDADYYFTLIDKLSGKKSFLEKLFSRS